MKKSKLTLLASASVVLMGLTLQGCSSPAEPPKVEFGFTAKECNTIGQARIFIDYRIHRYANITPKEFYERRDAIYASKYANLQEYLDELSQQAALIKRINLSETITDEERAAVLKMVSAIEVYNSHWTDDYGDELKASEAPIVEASLALGKLCSK